MMNTITHELLFSFDQPDSVLNSLHELITQRLRQPLAFKTSREMIVRNALSILVIDMHQERAQYLCQMLLALGYRPMMVANALDAFTLFLQGECTPIALIMGEKDGSNRLFLTRLLQQLVQRYDWEPLLIGLQFSVPQSLSTNDQPAPSGQLPQMPSFPPASPVAQPSSSVSKDTAPLRHLGVNKPSWADPPNQQQPFSDALPVMSSAQDTSASSALQSPAAEGPSPAQPNRELHGDTLSPLLPGTLEKVYLDGQSLGRFQVCSRVGSSPYSEVYKIYDRLREKEFALKAIQVDIVSSYMLKQLVEEITVFQQETELLEPLKHPHILPVFTCGKTYVSGANFIYKTMPLCSDGNLGTWIHRYGKPGSFSFKEIVPIVLQLADALQLAHNFQITYQNFKFSNILVLTPNRRIQKMEVALSDFSIVQDGSFISTAPDSLAYIAPERWDGIAHPASDQYGLAAIAYELFTGRPPFQANSERTMKILHITRLPQPPTMLNPKLPNALNAVLLRAMAKNPSDRFASLQRFMQALQRC